MRLSFEVILIYKPTSFSANFAPILKSWIFELFWKSIQLFLITPRVPGFFLLFKEVRTTKFRTNFKIPNQIISKQLQLLSFRFCLEVLSSLEMCIWFLHFSYQTQRIFYRLSELILFSFKPMFSKVRWLSLDLFDKKNLLDVMYIMN